MDQVTIHVKQRRPAPAGSDLRDHGIHASATGARKVADMPLMCLRTDLTAREWFLADP